MSSNYSLLALVSQQRLLQGVDTLRSLESPGPGDHDPYWFWPDTPYDNIRTAVTATDLPSRGHAAEGEEGRVVKWSYRRGADSVTVSFSPAVQALFAFTRDSPYRLLRLDAEAFSHPQFQFQVLGPEGLHAQLLQVFEPCFGFIFPNWSDTPSENTLMAGQRDALPHAPWAERYSAMLLGPPLVRASGQHAALAQLAESSACVVGVAPALFLVNTDGEYGVASEVKERLDVILRAISRVSTNAVVRLG